MNRITLSIVTACSLALPSSAQQFDDVLGEISVPTAQSEVLSVPIDPWSGAAADEWEWFGQPVGQPDADTLSPASATGNQFYIDFQVRARGEYRNGQGSLRDEGAMPAWFVGDRERLTLGFRRGAVSARLCGQHAGVWGDRGLDSKDGSFGLNEAWARVDFSRGWFLQVGRQVLSYDDERIFGADDWSTAGCSHDAARFGYERGLHRLHGVVSFNQTSARRIGGTYYDGAMPYKCLQLLWYHYGTEQQPLQFSLLGMNQGLEIGYKEGVKENPNTGFMQMVGGWFQYAKRGFYGKAEGYYQLGHDQNQRKMNAFLAGVRGGYKSQMWGGGVGFDYVSGAKSSIRRGTNKCFNLLYGSTHSFHGAMDYFVQGTMLSSGLMDAQATGNFRPLDNLTVEADYHYFLMAVERTNLKRPLGHEVDLNLSWRIARGVTLQAGYSVLIPQLSLSYFKGGNWKSWQDWGWLTLNFSPRLFAARLK